MTMTREEYFKFAAAEARSTASRRENQESRPRERIDRIETFGVILDVEVLTADDRFDAIGLITMYRNDRSRPGELYYCGKGLLGHERLDALIAALQTARAKLAGVTK